MKKFRIRAVSDYVLTEKQIWPDGDGPENPTAEDVQELIDSEYHSTMQMLEEWNLEPELDVYEEK